MKCHIALGLEYLRRPLIDVDLLMYREWHIAACRRMMAKPEGKNHTEDRGVGGSLMMTEWISKKSVRNAGG